MEPPPQQVGQQPYQDPLANSLGYIPRQQFDSDPVMSKHLDASEILIILKNTLLGLEHDEDEDVWNPVMVTIGYDKKGNKIEVEEGPLMEPKDIRISVSYLQMFLNPNTFLSQLKEEEIKDIMWDVSKKLAILFYNLRHKITTHERDMLWGMIEYPILLGLNRANRKITLDAISKMQQTTEIIQGNPQNQQQPPKEFKALGW